MIPRFLHSAPPGSPRVKLCGFTSAQSAAAAIEAGADAIGINFWPGSKRFIAPEKAAPWLGTLAGQVCRVGLFVNPSMEEIDSAVDLGVLDALQLHGITDPVFIEEAATFGLPVIQAIGVGEQGPLAHPADFPTPWILLDAHVPGAFGGTGKTFSWEQFHEVAAAHPAQHFLLAGGLTPENVAGAIRIAQPFAVDTASGVESAPGVKDPARMRAFVMATREQLAMRRYSAMVWIEGSSQTGRRVSVEALSLTEARQLLENEYGKGHVFDLHNPDDAEAARGAPPAEPFTPA